MHLPSIEINFLQKIKAFDLLSKFPNNKKYSLPKLVEFLARNKLLLLKNLLALFKSSIFLFFIKK